MRGSGILEGSRASDEFLEIHFPSSRGVSSADQHPSGLDLPGFGAASATCQPCLLVGATHPLEAPASCQVGTTVTWGSVWRLKHRVVGTVSTVSTQHAITLEFRPSAHSVVLQKIPARRRGNRLGRTPFPRITLAQVRWKMWKYFFGVSCCRRLGMSHVNSCWSLPIVMALWTCSQSLR